VVEEVSNHPADAAVHGHYVACVPAAVHRMQLPEGVCLVDRHARRHVLLPVQGILQATVHKTVETNGKHIPPDYNIILKLV